SSDPTPDQPAPSAGFPVEVERHDPSVPRPSQPGAMAPSDESIVQPGTDLRTTDAPGIGQRPIPQATPAPAPGVHGAPSDPAAIPPSAASGDHALAQQVSQSPNTNVPVALGAQEHSDLTGSETNGTGSQWSSETNGVGFQFRRADTAESHVARTQNGHLPADLPDGSLLQRFVVNGEQPAVTALLQRYERLVLGICQLVLADSHAAQDAFQATFVVLARKAGMLDKRRSLAGWLSKVAYRLALRWRAVTARRRRCEKQ